CSSDLRISASWYSAASRSRRGRWWAATLRAPRRCALTIGGNASILVGTRHGPAFAGEARDARMVEEFEQLDRQVAPDARAIAKARSVKTAVGCGRSHFTGRAQQRLDGDGQEEAVFRHLHQVAKQGRALEKSRRRRGVE